MKIIENNSVSLHIYEKARYAFQNIEKNGEYYVLTGNNVSPDKVIILDYFSDEIKYLYTPESNV